MSKSDTTYDSFSDIPSALAMAQYSSELKAHPNITAEQRKEVEKLDAQLAEISDTINSFYKKLGDRNWILHDNLNLEDIKNIAAIDKPDDAEAEFIKMYTSEKKLDFYLLLVNKFPEIRKREQNIKRAKEEYFAGRYDNCVLHLLCIVDGIVNEFESIHRGAHARDNEEFSGWDAVISVQNRLADIHKRIYTRQASVTNEEPCYDLYRNGIMHGVIINFDNQIIATKAWNFLFAICDWIEKKAYPKPPFDFNEEKIKVPFAGEINQNTISATGFEEAETLARQTCKEYLEYWKHSNYGHMSDYLLYPDKDTSFPKTVRGEFSELKLTEYSLGEISYKPPVVGEYEGYQMLDPATANINVTVKVNDILYGATWRWVFQADEGKAAIPSKDNGAWQFSMWGSTYYIKDENRVKAP